MEDHDRLVDERRHLDQTVDGLGFGGARMAYGMEFRRGVAMRQEALHHPGDHPVVLGMHANHGAALARHGEDVEQLLVLDLQPVVGHEHLERGMPRLDQRRNVFVERLAGRIGDDHVKGVVDDGAALGELVVIGDDLAQLHAAMLRGEGNDRRRAAEGRGGRGALETVGVELTVRRELLDVAMAVDAARQHELALRIDVALAWRKPLADRGDAFARDRDIGVEHVACGRDPSAANDDVVGFAHHGPPRRPALEGAW